MKKTKTTTNTLKRLGERAFEERYFAGKVLARFMSQIEQDKFYDQYKDNSKQRMGSVLTSPTINDYKIAKKFEDGAGYTRIAREMNITTYEVQSACYRVALFMMRAGKK